MKPLLYVLKGLPASGKTTKAYALVAAGFIRVNKDDIRAEHPHYTEQDVLREEDGTIILGLENQCNVVVDDTNLNPYHLKRLAKLAKDCNATLFVDDSFLAVPVEECIKRDSRRPQPVGETVIRAMRTKYLTEPYNAKALQERVKVEQTGGPQAFICDIDGTVALNMAGRGHYEYERVLEDLPNYNVVAIVATLIEDGFVPIFLSGRMKSGDCERDTDSWLCNYIPEAERAGFALHMREDGDYRPDDVVKYELFDKHIRDRYDVICVLDDRQRVVDMWREIGLTCLQVAPGDF